MALAAVSLIVMVGVTVDEALGIVSPSSSTRTLHAACDRVVERTTRSSSSDRAFW